MILVVIKVRAHSKPPLPLGRLPPTPTQPSSTLTCLLRAFVSQCEVRGPPAPGNLVKMQIPWPTPDSANQHLWGWGPVSASLTTS